MSGNHDPKAESGPPRPHLIATDSPHFGRWKANEQGTGQTDDGDPAGVLPPQAGEHAQADPLADFLWERQASGPDQVRQDAGARSAPDAGRWRDELLAELEDLTRMMKEKVTRYSSLRATQSSLHAAEPTNEMALLWIQQALEDIAATALGIHIASRELFLQAASAGEGESHRAVPGSVRKDPADD